MDDQVKIDETQRASDEELDMVVGGTSSYHTATVISTVAPSASGLLLFDEADSLFGKRTSVTDSHDRYGKP